MMSVKGRSHGSWLGEGSRLDCRRDCSGREAESGGNVVAEADDPQSPGERAQVAGREWSSVTSADRRADQTHTVACPNGRIRMRLQVEPSDRLGRTPLVIGHRDQVVAGLDVVHDDPSRLPAAPGGGELERSPGVWRRPPPREPASAGSDVRDRRAAERRPPTTYTAPDSHARRAQVGDCRARFDSGRAIATTRATTQQQLR